MAGALSQNRPTAPDIVTAVLVAHDGARWLPETLEAVQKQTRRPDRFVAADNGSRDRGPALLNEALGAERIISLPRSTGYGEAITNALRLPAASMPVPVPPSDEPPVEWIWLLHDDSAPDPRALANLLETAARDPRARVIGPKVRDWHDHRVLLEAGVTIDRAGRRETGLEPREMDQGQRDGDREVLAVGSAGMLVRRDVWDELGGFDPRIALFRDDIDFCWRAGAAGYKVLLTTTAIMYHAEASARRRRRIATDQHSGAKRLLWGGGGARGRPHPLRVDRQNALYVLFANLPAGALLVSMVRGFFGSLLRTLLFLIAKQPGAAIDELTAVASAYGRPVRLLVARRERARTRRRSYSAIRPFMARGLAAARLAAMISGAFGGNGPMASAGQHHAGTFGDDEDDEAELLSDSRGPLRRALSNPGVLLFLALAVVTVAAERSLLFGGALGGGALVPVTGGASDLWRQYVEGYHQVGLGSADPAPPATAIVALVATVLGGSVPAAVGVLLLGCVPFAGLVVYVATRGILPYRPARVWLAASYALLPVATGAIAAGRLGTAVAIVVIPVIGVFFAHMLGRQGARARRAAWAAGLLLAVAMAFVPLVWPLSVVVGGLVAVAFGGEDNAAARSVSNGVAGGRAGQKALFVNVGIVVLTPPILLGPWAWALFAHPSRFLLETGLHRAGLSDPALSAESLLLLSPGGPGVPPIWMTAGFLVAGLAALSLRKHRVLIAIGWGVTLFGLLVAILVSRMTPEPATGGPPIAAWPGVALVLAAGGLLMTAAIAAGPVWDLVRAGGWRRAAGIAIVAIACSSPVLTAGAWVWRGADQPLNRHPDNVMPPAVAALSGNRTATLVVRPENGAVAYSVLRGRVPMFGEDQIHPPDAARVRLDALVSGLMSGRGGDDGHALAQYGIRFVLVPAPAVKESLHRLDGVPGMSRMTMTSQYAVWRVTGPTAREWIEGPDGSVTAVPGAPSTTIPAGKPGRVLETAEPFDGGWSATLNGHDLAPVKLHGWAQGFRIPASGGRLEIGRGTFPHDIWIWAQGLALLVLIVLALPGARRDPDAEDAEESRAAKAKRKRQHQPRRARGHRRVEPQDEPAALPASREMHALPGPAPETESPLTTTVNAFQALQAGQYRAEDPVPPAEPERGASAEPYASPAFGWGVSPDPVRNEGPEPEAGAPYGREPVLGAVPEPGPVPGPNAVPAAENGGEPRAAFGAGYGAGRSGLGAYVREPQWSAGGTGGARPDPLAGTPLSREIPVNTSETPTPLAGGHPYAHEYPPGGSGGRPTGHGPDDPAIPEPEHPATPTPPDAPEPEPESSYPPEPETPVSDAYPSVPQTPLPSDPDTPHGPEPDASAESERPPEPRAGGEAEWREPDEPYVPEAEEAAFAGTPEPEPVEADAGEAETAPGEQPSVPDAPMPSERPSEPAPEPAAEEPNPPEPGEPGPPRPEALEHSSGPVPYVPEPGDQAGPLPESEASHPAEADDVAERPSWFDEGSGWDGDLLRRGGGSDEADEMVSGDVDEEPSRDVRTADDEHAGRPR